MCAEQASQCRAAQVPGPGNGTTCGHVAGQRALDRCCPGVCQVAPTLRLLVYRLGCRDDCGALGLSLRESENLALEGFAVGAGFVAELPARRSSEPKPGRQARPHPPLIRPYTRGIERARFRRAAGRLNR